MNIITDTGSLLTQDQAKKLKVNLIPLQVHIQGKNYRDYFDISSPDFIQLTKAAVPQSSQPAIGDVMETFEASKEGIYLAMTSGLSATFTSAAALKVQENYTHIEVFNTQTLAAAQGYMVELAQTLNQQGESKDAILNALNLRLSGCKSYLIPVDFDYLKRNGRLSGVAALMSGLLKIKPIVYHEPGMEKLERFGVGRTWTHAFDAIIEDLEKRQVGLQHKVFICHAENLEVARQAQARLEERLGKLDVSILPLSPVMITQGGPGCIAIQTILK